MDDSRLATESTPLPKISSRRGLLLFEWANFLGGLFPPKGIEFRDERFSRVRDPT